MTRTARLLALLLASLLLAACGGGDGGDGEASSPSKQADSRKGYFTEAQSTKLNPLLADYDTASAKYYSEAEACQKTADRLFKAGKSPRQSVQCHMQLTKGYLAAVQRLRAGFESIDGEYREACDEQVAEFTSFLEDFEQQLTTVQADWEAYASGRKTPKIQQHSTAVDDTAASFVEEQVPGISKACYTKADREADEKS